MAAKLKVIRPEDFWASQQSGSESQAPSGDSEVIDTLDKFIDKMEGLMAGPEGRERVMETLGVFAGEVGQNIGERLGLDVQPSLAQQRVQQRLQQREAGIVNAFISLGSLKSEQIGQLYETLAREVKERKVSPGVAMTECILGVAFAEGKIRESHSQKERLQESRRKTGVVLLEPKPN